MAKKGITGHDEWIVTEALATALIALEQLRPKHQPRTHMEDLKNLLTATCQPGSVPLHLAQAKCRLFPNTDRMAIYQDTALWMDRTDGLRPAMHQYSITMDQRKKIVIGRAKTQRIPYALICEAERLRRTRQWSISTTFSRSNPAGDGNIGTL
jgi:hypothetical protein